MPVMGEAAVIDDKIWILLGEFPKGIGKVISSSINTTRIKFKDGTKFWVNKTDVREPDLRDFILEKLCENRG